MSDLLTYDLETFRQCKNGVSHVTQSIQPFLDRIQKVFATFTCFQDNGYPPSFPAHQLHHKGPYTRGGGGGQYHHHRNNHHHRRATHFVSRPMLAPRKAILKDALSAVRGTLNKLTKSNAHSLFPHILEICADPEQCTTVLHLILDKCFVDSSYISLYVSLISKICDLHSDHVRGFLKEYFQNVFDQEWCGYLEHLKCGGHSTTREYEGFCQDQKIKQRLMNQNHTYLGLMERHLIPMAECTPYFERLLSMLQKHKEYTEITETLSQVVIDVHLAFKSMRDLKIKMTAFYKNELEPCCNNRTRFKFMDIIV